MWEKLPTDGKKEYKRLILAFASLTGMFAQKASDGEQDAAPIINSNSHLGYFKGFNNCYILL